MSGIYIHIPFCKKACHYCDFHFSTNINSKTEMAMAIAKEIELRADYLEDKSIKTIYFGGGTPSLLNEEEFSIIFASVYKNFKVDNSAEITLEANPDDLTIEKIRKLKKLPFNRLSIGIQSFYGPHLQYMNRAHNEREGESCVKAAQDIGFDNITIDLIYSIPHPGHSVWQNDLTKAVELEIQHISAYSLTIEENTVFGKRLKKGRLSAIDEEFSVKQYELLIEYLENKNFEQYEISNFCQPGRYSIHNSNYWKRKNYVGIGPSAHSFDGSSRQWNVSNNRKYLDSISKNLIPSTKEILSVNNQANEHLLTTLRTKWGTDLNELNKISGINFLETNQKTIKKYISSGLIDFSGNFIFLTQQGKLLADEITVDLFLD